MYTPVHDFKKSLNDDYKRYLKYLKEKYPNRIDDKTRDSLKKLHKNLWLLHIVKETLEEENAYFQDVFSNILSLIHSTIIKDRKIINFLSRNTIESFIKFSKIFCDKIDVNNNPREIFEEIFKTYKDNNYMHNKYQAIKSSYSLFCGVVHGRNIETSKMSKCLKEYENLFSSVQILKEIEEFNKIILNFIIIYFYNFPQKFNHLVGDSQYIIRDAIFRDDLIKILERL